ncbi:MAG: serine/threonine protein kinase [Deltaproteobacteria bacterium]|nr:serine/threonine protein kinase [Deltaproteobacteria bacterium]MBK8718296.1 serine/threonine protein kinase [Deltaproteobacteria bacterium]MBP7291447.1 serine/threonine protein kinase [Nannocystaceae bacterium]
MPESGFDAFDGRNPPAGKYRPLRRLAVGGMAEIFLAFARSGHGFEKLVVLKRVLPAYAENREFMRMFLDEARLAATLDHPNIVHVYDIGEHAGNFFFAMEYVHGQSLLKLMRQITNARRWLPLEHALNVIIGTCAGMHYAHEKLSLDGRRLGIVHRDVSPPNILISYDGSVKVADFGIAKASTATTSTAVGTLKGKIPYMSPEQCRSAPLDRRSDIFSIGILLYELTVGRRLFQAESELGIIHKIVNGIVPPPSQLLRGYPEDLERIVYRALQLDPEHRYPTARALQVDLEEFAREYKLPISSVRLASFMEEMFDEETRAWPTDPSAGQRPSTREVPAASSYDLPGGPGAARPSRPQPTAHYGGEPSSRQVTPPPMSRRGQTGPNPTVSEPVEDFASIEQALSRMLAEETNVGRLTSELGEPGGDAGGGDDWFGLDNLELEDLFPAKQKR